MEAHILTLFPESIEAYFNASLLGRARQNGIIKVMSHQLRDYATTKYKSVDDAAYGGGPGLVMCPDVITNAVRDLKGKYPQIQKTFLLSPRGRVLTQSVVLEMGSLKAFLLVCGRYEGVDQRAIDLVIDEEISLGDFVITGGELGAAVIVDAVARFVPGVLGDQESALTDSFGNGLLEYPHYTRPAVFEGLAVPEVLLSGNHAKIDEWRMQESLKITKERRPDLLKT